MVTEEITKDGKFTLSTYDKSGSVELTCNIEESFYTMYINSTQEKILRDALIFTSEDNS